MIRWIDRVRQPAVEAGDAAQDHPEHQADHHGDETDRQRRARREHHPRPHVAALQVGPEQEKRLLRVDALDPDQVPVGWDEPEELVVEAGGEEGQRNDLGRILGVHPLECRRVALPDHRVDMRAELAIEEEPDLLRRDQTALRVGRLGVGVGEKVGQQHHQVEQDHGDSAEHRQAVLAEAPPHQLRLGSNRHPLLGISRQQWLAGRGEGRQRTRRGDGGRGGTGGLLRLERGR